VLNGKSDVSDIPEDTSGAEQESAQGSVQEQTTVQEQTGEQQAGGCKSAFAGAAGALLTAAAAAIALGKKTRK
jgi:hypothetical protein